MSLKDEVVSLSSKGVFGIVDIATESDGVAHSGKHLDSVRHPYRRLRRKLQKKGTKGAKRCLKKLSGKERRFSRVNHTLGKRIVGKAQCAGRGIAIGDSTGIREQEAPTLHLAQLLFDLGL